MNKAKYIDIKEGLLLQLIAADNWVSLYVIDSGNNAARFMLTLVAGLGHFDNYIYKRNCRITTPLQALVIYRLFCKYMPPQKTSIVIEYS